MEKHPWWQFCQNLVVFNANSYPQQNNNDFLKIKKLLLRVFSIQSLQLSFFSKAGKMLYFVLRIYTYWHGSTLHNCCSQCLSTTIDGAKTMHHKIHCFFRKEKYYRSISGNSSRSFDAINKHDYCHSFINICVHSFLQEKKAYWQAATRYNVWVSSWLISLLQSESFCIDFVLSLMIYSPSLTFTPRRPSVISLNPHC